MFGYQQAGNRNQVYYDSQTGQYYTLGGRPKDGSYDPANRVRTSSAFGFPTYGYKNYLGQAPFNANNQSMIAQMLANRQPYQYNAPNAQQMFPGMGNPMMGTMPTQSQGNPMLGGGLFGAGRFLGGGLLNSTSTTGV